MLCILVLFQRPLTELKMASLVHLIGAIVLVLYFFMLIRNSIVLSIKNIFLLFAGFIFVCLSFISALFSNIVSLANPELFRLVLSIAIAVTLHTSLKFLDQERVSKILKFCIVLTCLLLLLWVASGGESKALRANNPLAQIFEIYTGNRLLLPQYLIISFLITLIDGSLLSRHFLVYTFLSLLVAYTMPGLFSFYALLFLFCIFLFLSVASLKLVKASMFVISASIFGLAIVFYEDVLNAIEILGSISRSRSSQIYLTYDYWNDCAHCFYIGYGVGGTSELSTGSKGNDLIAHNMVVFFLFELGFVVFTFVGLVIAFALVVLHFVNSRKLLKLGFIFVVVIALSLIKPLFMFYDYFVVILLTPLMLIRDRKLRFTRTATS